MQLNTLKKNKEFNLVYSRGVSYSSKSVVLICLRRKYGMLRIGITVSKKIGCAVKRNRVKRQIKEILMEQMQYLRGNWFLVFVARKGISEESYSNISRDINYLLKKSKIKQ